MPATSSRAAVPCPTCGHDLRGLRADDGLYRCPECGVYTNLRGIARERTRRARTWIIIALVGLILAVLIVMIAR